LIPIITNKEIESYLHKTSNEQSFIQTEDLISNGTSILKLIEILNERDFSFVLSENKISGYVHYSDLNNQLVKIPLYVLFEALESDIIRSIGDKIDEQVIREVIPEKAENHIENIEKRKKKNVDLSLKNFLYLRELLLIAKHLDYFQLSEKEIDQINEIRNRVDHADRSLILSREDIRLINEVRLCCLKLLDLRKR
jgi:hypothetical protein